jgi:outer membrane protein TolC
LAWLDLKNRLVAAYQIGHRAHDQVEIYLDEVLPAARRAVDLSTAGYEAGKFTYLEVLDAQRSLSSAMQTYVEALVEYRKARADLEALVASRVPEVSEDGETDDEAEHATPDERKTERRSSTCAKDPHRKKESR